MNKRILVTGADGQLGRAFRLILGENEQILYTNRSNLDITNADAEAETVARFAPEVILNCAAYTDVERAEEERDAAFRVNSNAVSYLAEAAKQTDALLVHISTDYLFDGSQSAPIPESAAPHPLNVYGESKLAGEQALIASGCRYLIFRTSWLYSPWGDNFVRNMLRLAAERDTLYVVDDQTGTPTYAPLLADAILRIIERGAPLERQIFNYSSEGQCTRYQMIASAVRASQYADCRVLPCPSSLFPTKAVRPAYSVLDKSKIRRALHHYIDDWEDTLYEFVQNDFSL